MCRVCICFACSCSMQGSSTLAKPRNRPTKDSPETGNILRHQKSNSFPPKSRRGVETTRSSPRHIGPFALSTSTDDRRRLTCRHVEGQTFSTFRHCCNVCQENMIRRGQELGGIPSNNGTNNGNSLQIGVFKSLDQCVPNTKTFGSRAP